MFLKSFSPVPFYILTWQLENFKLHVWLMFVAHIIFLLDSAVLFFFCKKKIKTSICV